MMSMNNNLGLRLLAFAKYELEVQFRSLHLSGHREHAPGV